MNYDTIFQKLTKEEITADSQRYANYVEIHKYA